MVAAGVVMDAVLLFIDSPFSCFSSRRCNRCSRILHYARVLFSRSADNDDFWGYGVGSDVAEKYFKADGDKFRLVF